MADEQRVEPARGREQAFCTCKPRIATLAFAARRRERKVRHGLFQTVKHFGQNLVVAVEQFERVRELRECLQEHREEEIIFDVVVLVGVVDDPTAEARDLRRQLRESGEVVGSQRFLAPGNER